MKYKNSINIGLNNPHFFSFKTCLPSFPGDQKKKHATENPLMWNDLVAIPCPVSSIHCLDTSLIARFMGPTWGPSGPDKTQVGPIKAPWTLLSGRVLKFEIAENALAHCFSPVCIYIYMYIYINIDNTYGNMLWFIIPYFFQIFFNQNALIHFLCKYSLAWFYVS